MADNKPQVYEGDRSYVFVSYAHADGAAMTIIRALADEGYRVWYDDGIQAGSSFSDYIADRLYDCSCVLMLVSRSSLVFGRCRNEVEYALDLGRPVLPVYLEDVELPRALHMCLGTVQPLYWYAYDTDDDFNDKLFSVKMLGPCLTNGGKQRKGVGPKTGRSTTIGTSSEGTEGVKSKKKCSKDKVLEATEPVIIANLEVHATDGADDHLNGHDKTGRGQRKELHISKVAKVAILIIVITVIGVFLLNDRMGQYTQQKLNSTVSANDMRVNVTDDNNPKLNALVDGVEPKSELNDYAWDELKQLSAAIAIADASGDEWLDIAKAYNLVDAECKLQGDKKTFMLNDTQTSVRILGFLRDERADGGKIGISFEFADVPTTHRMNEKMTNDGGWEKSGMRKWLNSEFLSFLPSDLQSCIETVKKQTNNVGLAESESDTSLVSSTIDKLWLLSSNEVYGGLEGVHELEGTQYKLYADCGVSAYKYDYRQKRGADSEWWLRSPGNNDSRWFFGVGRGGDWIAHYAHEAWGVSPGFCF